MSKKMKATVFIVAIIFIILAVNTFAATSSPVPTISVAPSAKTSVEPSVKASVTPNSKPTTTPSQTATATTSQTPTPSPVTQKKDDADQDLTDDVIKQDNKIMYDPAKDPNSQKYLKEWKSRYAVDQVNDPGLLDFITGGVDPGHFLVNVLFQFQKTAIEVVIEFVNLAFTFDPTTWLHDIVKNTISGIYSNTFNKVAMIMLAIVGAYMTLQLARQRKNKVFSSILKTVLVLAAAEYFFLHPIQIMDTVSEYTNTISISFASNVFYDENTPASERADKWPVDTAANGIFYEYVHKPWQVLEFGSSDTAKKESIKDYGSNESKILSMPLGKKRTGIYTDIQKKENFTVSSTKRLGFILFYFVPLAINIVVIMLMCMLVLAYKFYLLLLVFMGIFIFPLALLPGTGTKILKEWGIKILGVGCMQIVLVFLLGLMLQLNSAILKSATKNGWLITILIQSMIYTFIFLKRKEILRIFNKVQRGAANPARFNTSIGMAMREIGTGDTLKPVMRGGTKVKNAAVKVASTPKRAYSGGKNAVYGLAKKGAFGKKMQIIATAKGVFDKKSSGYTDKLKALKTANSDFKKVNAEKAAFKTKKAQEHAKNIEIQKQKAQPTNELPKDYSRILAKRMMERGGNNGGFKK